MSAVILAPAFAAETRSRFFCVKLAVVAQVGPTTLPRKGPAAQEGDATAGDYFNGIADHGTGP